MSFITCPLAQSYKVHVHVQHCNLLLLESRRIERDMHTVFKLIHGLHGITLEHAGLSLCNSITRGSGVRLKKGHVTNNANLFKYRAPQQWNSLPLNIVQCTNFTSFKSKLFVHLQENDMTFFKFETDCFIHLIIYVRILFICFYTILWQGGVK